MPFVVAGVITTILALFVLWVLGRGKGGEEVSSSSSEPEIGILKLIQLILKSLVFWQIGTVAFFWIWNIRQPSRSMVRALSDLYQRVFSCSGRKSPDPIGHWCHFGKPHWGTSL